MNQDELVLSNLPTILGTILENQERSAKFQVQAQKELRLELKRELALVHAKLDRVEANTIMIRDRVISEFEGIQPDTKQTIEESILAVIEDPEVMSELEEFYDAEKQFQDEQKAFKNDFNHPGLQRRTRGSRLGLIKPASFFKSLNSKATKGELTAVGNWVSGVMGKVIGKPTFGKYPPVLKLVVSNLVDFYALERQSNGRMY